MRLPGHPLIVLSEQVAAMTVNPGLLSTAARFLHLDEERHKEFSLAHALLRVPFHLVSEVLYILEI